MCSVMNCKKYEQIDNSDKNIAMIATTVFDDLVGRVKASNLNFTIQLSPFSAYISLKKSFIRDKAGAFILPNPANTVTFGKEAEYDMLKSDNIKLQKEVESLKNMNQTLMDDLACSKAVINDLKSIQADTVKCSESVVENLSPNILIKKETLDNLETISNKVQEGDDILLDHTSIQERTIDEKEQIIKQLVLDAESSIRDYEEKLETSRKEAKVLKRELKSKEIELVEFQERFILNSSSYNYRHVHTQTPFNSFKTTGSQTEEDQAESQGKEKFSCTFCHQAFESEIYAKKHEELHPVWCPKCRICFETLDDVNTHQENIHDRKKK